MKRNKSEAPVDVLVLRDAVVDYLDARQAAIDAVQWRDWESLEDLEADEQEALAALQNLVGWEAPDDNPEAIWNEGKGEEGDDVLLGSDSNNSNIDPAAEGVDVRRQTAFAEPGTVGWNNRKPFPKGHVGVEGVDAKEVASFLDDIGRGGTDAKESDTAGVRKRLRDNGIFYADLAADNLTNAERVEQLERLIVAWADDLDAEGYAEWSVCELALRRAVGR